MSLAKKSIALLTGWRLMQGYARFAAHHMAESNSYIAKAMLALVFAFIVPVVMVAFVMGFFLSIDQVTYPEHALDAKFMWSEEHAQTSETPAERAVRVTQALTYQLERELENSPGWTSNDLAGMSPLAWQGFMDNRNNRQRGVIHAVRQLTAVWSRETSKLGLADAESQQLLKAYQEGFAISSEDWMFPSAEGKYGDGIAAVREYERLLLAGASDARTNVLTRDLVTMLRVMVSDVLAEPYGRLIARNAEVSWVELDDAVYRAQGAAIVVRDVLAALNTSYHDEMMKGAMGANVQGALDSLDAAARFNPVMVMRGDGDSLVADHRSNMARYLSEAIERINETADSLRN